MPKLRQFALVLAVGFALVSSTIAQDSTDFSKQKSSRRTAKTAGNPQANSKTGTDQRDASKEAEIVAIQSNAKEIKAEALSILDQTSKQQPVRSTPQTSDQKTFDPVMQTGPRQPQLNQPSSSRRVAPTRVADQLNAKRLPGTDSAQSSLAAKTPTWTNSGLVRNSTSDHKLIVTKSGATPNNIRQTATPRISTKSFLPANKNLENESASPIQRRDLEEPSPGQTAAVVNHGSSRRIRNLPSSNLATRKAVPSPVSSTQPAPKNTSVPIVSKSQLKPANEIIGSGITQSIGDDAKFGDIPKSLPPMTTQAEVLATKPSSDVAKPAIVKSPGLTPIGTSIGSSTNLSDEQPTATRNVPTRLAALPSSNSAASPMNPLAGGTSLNMKTLSDFSFKSPNQFLSKRKFQFASSNKFLKYLKEKEGQNGEAQDKSNPMRLPKANLVKKVPTKRARTRITPSNEIISRQFDDDDESRYLNVKSVDEPIADNPFADIRQRDDSKLLESASNSFAVADPTTYGTLTGQPDQMHLATYQAHNFKHRPLYFEEVNLERYGNELRFQPVVSAAHFFTSAAILPYQMGAVPPGCCLSTLGHQRPGDCVPYQIHWLPQSRKGWLYQGLFITALSL